MDHYKIYFYLTDGRDMMFSSKHYEVHQDDKGYLVTEFDSKNWYYFPFNNVLYVQRYGESEKQG